MVRLFKSANLVLITGLVIGALAVILTYFGNPKNMGICIACFIRDIAGGLGLHSVAVVQYIRPEIIGIILGAFIAAKATNSFNVVGGSNFMIRFALSFAGMIGFLVFLGCPLRMLIRMSAGDLYAWIAFPGFIAGIAIGTWFLNRGFSLGRALPQNKASGYVFPAIFAILLVLLLADFSYLQFSAKGPGSMYAPIFISLGAGLLIGILAQRSRFCLIGAIRDMIMFKDYYLFIGMAGLFTAAFIGNLLTNNFNLSFENQPIANPDILWNFLGLLLAGLCFTLLGGCPLRQLISVAEGNTDSAVTVLGILIGAAFAHNFGLAASPSGVPFNGQFAIIFGLLIVLVICIVFSQKNLYLRNYK
ncbi:YedE family putative selenium transporter [Peptococcaceae bacterium]|nr:YedE family putative selenium transporter [Peptococcaceae bacterium]